MLINLCVPKEPAGREDSSDGEVIGSLAHPACLRHQDAPEGLRALTALAKHHLYTVGLFLSWIGGRL